MGWSAHDNHQEASLGSRRSGCSTDGGDGVYVAESWGLRVSFFPAEERGAVPLPILEGGVMVFDAIVIRLVAAFGPYQQDHYAPVGWMRALEFSELGNAASFFVGVVGSGEPWDVKEPWQTLNPTRRLRQQPPRRAVDRFMKLEHHPCKPRLAPAAVPELIVILKSCVSCDMSEPQQTLCDVCLERPATHHTCFGHTGETRNLCVTCFEEAASPGEFESLRTFQRIVSSGRCKYCGAPAVAGSGGLSIPGVMGQPPDLWCEQCQLELAEFAKRPENAIPEDFDVENEGKLDEVSQHLADRTRRQEDFMRQRVKERSR